MRQEFFKKVLPSQGVYCAVAIPPGNDPIQRFVGTIDELVELTADCDGANIYIAPNSFDGITRKADSAQWSRSIFIDLDVGPTKPFESKQAARNALQDFITRMELPDPTVVDSGTGIHAYWPFMEDVPIAIWRTYASRFKTLCQREGLMIDPAITADAARIMRCPDTFNYKTDPPSPTKVLSERIYQYSFEDFKEFLDAKIPEVNGHAVLATVQKGLDDATKALLRVDNQATEFSTLATKSLEGSGCEQIKFVLTQPNDVSYDLWLAALSVAARCDDADTAIHKMSEDYDGYNPADTRFKANETLKATGPNLCATFDSKNPGVCPNCPHWGKLHPQSPIALARSIRLAPTETEAEPKADYVLATTPPPFPDSLKPYRRGANGGIYYFPTNSDDDDPPELILPYDLYPIRRLYNPAEGDCLEMVYVTPHDGTRTFLLSVKSMYSQEKLSEAVCKYGIMPDPGHLKHLISYLIKWGRHMLSDRRAEDMRMQMGFTEDKQVFVIGNREFTATGVERQAPSGIYIRDIAKLHLPKGEYKDWRRAADELNHPGMELHAFTMMCAFGSPLMHLTSTSGAAISLHGTTGAAKTGALYGCLSVYGSPKELSVFESTYNAGLQRMLSLNNLPMGRDEATNMEPISLSNLIHTISSGKSKIRLQSTVNAERELQMSASLIAIFTSNHSLHDRLQIKKASPEGEMARLIEFAFEEKPALIANDPARAKQIFDTFRTCYGHAGPMFVKAMFEQGFDNIRVKIRKWSDKFLKTFGTNSAYRFYENLIAATFAGAEVANEYNIVNFDLDRIFNRIMVHLCSIKDDVRLNDLDYGSVVAEYIHKNIQNFLVMDGDRMVQEPRGHLVGRVEVQEGIQYVSKREFKKYLADLQVSPKEFEHSARTGNLLIKDVKQRLSSGWRAGMGTAPVAVYGFKADVEELIKELQGAGTR